jgi:hypothetical protein
MHECILVIDHAKLSIALFRSEQSVILDRSLESCCRNGKKEQNSMRKKCGIKDADLR